jgi:REP element-mobilizing transposase RayT
MATASNQFHSHPAHPPPVIRANNPTVLFVTICVCPRRRILANEVAHFAMNQAWQGSTHWLVGRYMVMPDHVHFFCSPGTHQPPGIRRWSGFWKRAVGKVDPSLKRVFQEDCWDVQIRDAAHFDEKLSYMMNNPVRAGLVESSDQWPYQGKVHEVGWF